MYNSGKGRALIKQVQFDRVDIYTNYYLQIIFYLQNIISDK